MNQSSRDERPEEPSRGGPAQRRSTPFREKPFSVLSIAAAIGREFSVATISSVSARPIEQVQSILDDALRAKIIAEVSSAQGIYRFSRELFQQSLYEDLSITHRTWLRSEITKAFERIPSTAATP